MIVAAADRREAGRQLGQRGRRGKDSRAEQHAGQTDMVRGLAAAFFEQSPGDERHPGGAAEHGQGLAGTHAVLVGVSGPLAR